LTLGHHGTATPTVTLGAVRAWMIEAMVEAVRTALPDTGGAS
jgi:hypothetical protein